MIEVKPMEYEAVIGLEVHAELSTKSKIFCSCTTEFGGQPNTHCCPICLGMPGTLPVLNKKAVEYAIKAGLATNCTISLFTKQDRKNYFYPDLPKGYQISQYDLPLCKDGYVEIETENGKKKIRINRIHIEEDAGKLVHSEYGNYSFVDYNRTGVPLIEIVSEPDISSAAEAKAYLEKLKAILQFIGVSDCKMEEGSLRADVNISVRPKGSKQLGERTEMKNLNSFRAVYRAIEAEVARQIEVIKSGGVIHRETRRWDDAKGESYPMRSKEDAQDYRYFPEPDLPPLIIKKELIERLKNELPELPDARKQRYISEYGLPEYDAGVLTSSKELSDFFEEAAKASTNVKAVSNWVMGDMLRILREKNMEIAEIPFPPAYLAKLVALIDKGVINGPTAKKVFEEMFDTGKDPETIVKEQGLEVLNDESVLLEVVERVIQENPNSVADYKKGKKKAIGFLVGQAMKATKGKANPQLINELLIKKLEG
ncbi:MAG: Asp-tRNA(Asn)/Glu-tRNA(Gln) amidotransferase subunit GatB [Caldicoprobacter oshimai]|nr:Asp-tRNA(Asn)/Glu-tRNA(Gln) amidotransferase subunit GatB [Caldicoprobacter faecalis]PZN10556.1 MAG: Asp-tRNA(Asn)/Glu-tRNA(Gln) amidotransferase subunit GatB [Caldicoprobacter oshimai]